MTEMTVSALASIGIPTKGRALLLSRALRSVMSQSYQPVEIIISDNASTDGTAQLCSDLSAQHHNIRYLRQSTPVPASTNFQLVLREAQGAFFMWLADDDWLGPDYLTHCVRVLLDQPDVAAVVGRLQYSQGESIVEEGDRLDLCDRDAVSRVLKHFMSVSDNGNFYSLCRTEYLRKTSLPNQFGGDWLTVGGLAALGAVRSIATVALNRELGGDSADLDALARTFPGPAIQKRHPRLALALSAFADIGFKSGAYQTLGWATRAYLGWRVYRILSKRYRTSIVKAIRAELKIRTRLRRLAGTFASSRGGR
jgi:glycosyltransferase involved in cell wall biosynthesis